VRSPGIITVSAKYLLVTLAMLSGIHSAHAHGIAGNRFFPGTLTFDDPAVADEAIVPNWSSSKHPDGGGNVADNRLNWAFIRLLTPTLAVGIDSGWIHRNWGTSLRSGLDVTNLTVKGLAYRTISTRFLCPQDSVGASAIQERKA
jgi:hypothetical protein